LVNLASYGGCIDPVTRGQRGFLVLKETPAVQTLLSEMKAFPYRPGKKVKVAHNRLKLNSTTRTRTDFVGDPHGPNGDSPQKKSVRVRAGPVGSVSGPCSGI